MIRRRAIQSGLGVLWFLDGILQLKPKMFSKQFVSQVVAPTAQNEPGWVAHLVYFGAHFEAISPVFWNALFALVQCAVGAALMFHIRTRISLSVSIFWSLVVWVFGEGFGQLFTGQTLLLSGAPGAALLYGMVSVAVWPRTDLGVRRETTVDWQSAGIRFARYALGLLWILGCVLHFQSEYVDGHGIASHISVRWLAHLVSTHQGASTLTFGIVEFGIGLLLLVNVRHPLIPVLSITVSFVYWWVGQSFGQIFNPFATDVNSGPLMILLTFAAYPYLSLRMRKPPALSQTHAPQHSGPHARGVV